MPLYEYQCEACGKRFEVIQRFSDAPADTCRVCGKGPVQRLISSPAIQFKGTGWYITDYSQKGKPSASESSGSSDATAKSESKAATEGKAATDSTSSSTSSPASSSATTSTKSD